MPPTPAPTGNDLTPSRRTARANALPHRVSPRHNNRTPPTRPQAIRPARRPNAPPARRRNIRRRIPHRKAQAAAPRRSSRSRPRLRVSLPPRRRTRPGNTLAQPQLKARLQRTLLRQQVFRWTAHSSRRPLQASPPPTPVGRQVEPVRKGQLRRSNSRPRGRRRRAVPARAAQPRRGPLFLPTSSRPRPLRVSARCRSRPANPMQSRRLPPRAQPQAGTPTRSQRRPIAQRRARHRTPLRRKELRRARAHRPRKLVGRPQQQALRARHLAHRTRHQALRPRHPALPARHPALRPRIRDARDDHCHAHGRRSGAGLRRIDRWPGRRHGSRVGGRNLLRCIVLRRTVAYG